MTKQINITDVSIVWHEYGTVSSTMEIAHQLTAEGFPFWTFITAHHQTKGRGTHGREWISPYGKGLWVSAILPPPLIVGSLEHLSLLTAKTLKKALEDSYPISLSIKYPNDILSRGRKLAGIMYESVTRDDHVLSVILGMGVNISQTEEDFKDAGLDEATSLVIEANSYYKYEDIFLSFCNNFIPMYSSITAHKETYNINIETHGLPS